MHCYSVKAEKVAYKQSSKFVYANTTFAKDLGVSIKTIEKATVLLENIGMLESVSVKNDSGENRPFKRTIFSFGFLSSDTPKGKKTANKEATAEDETEPGSS